MPNEDSNIQSVIQVLQVLTATCLHVHFSVDVLMTELLKDILRGVQRWKRQEPGAVGH